MSLALLISGALLGLAGAPHCLAMCGAACAALTGGTSWQSSLPLKLSFHLSRAASYGVGGAVVASSVGGLITLTQGAPVLRPLWGALHLGALGLGLWLLWQGRQPEWLERFGRSPMQLQTKPGWLRIVGPARATAGGALWVAWPCGLLQSALLVAALANSAVGGAAVMVTFAATSSAGLIVGPALWRRLGANPAMGGRMQSMAVRAAGAILAAASAWALGHDLFVRVAAYCLS